MGGGLEHVKLALPFLYNEEIPAGAELDEKDDSVFHNQLLIITLTNRLHWLFSFKSKLRQTRILPWAKSWEQSRPCVDLQMKVWGSYSYEKRTEKSWSTPQFIRVHIFSVWVCVYHLSRCMLASFSGSVGGNMVGRICVWRLLGTWDQSEYHWPSLVISYGDNSRLSVWSNWIRQDAVLPSAVRLYSWSASMT